MLELINEAKTLYNGYVKAKANYSQFPSVENKSKLKDSLLSFLDKVLSIAQVFETNTESDAEREALKQFSNELSKVFM